MNLLEFEQLMTGANMPRCLQRGAMFDFLYHGSPHFFFRPTPVTSTGGVEVGAVGETGIAQAGSSSELGFLEVGSPLKRGALADEFVDGDAVFPLDPCQDLARRHHLAVLASWPMHKPPEGGQPGSGPGSFSWGASLPDSIDIDLQKGV